MKILDRYIGIAVLGSTLVVLSVLLALFAFITFVGELDDVGRGNYGLLEVTEYVLLRLPRYTYQFFPVAALLGSLIGLGLLASNSELVVMRASGISIKQVVLSVMKAGFLLMIMVIVLGEFVAIKSEQYAVEMRSEAISKKISLKTQSGFWTRDGKNFINIETINPDGALTGVNIYQFNERHQLQVVTNAGSATYENGHWELEKIVRSEFVNQRVETTELPTTTWDSLLSPSLLDLVVIKPERLSWWELYRYSRFLENNELDSSRYSMKLWEKTILPFSTGVMVFLAIPFVFGPLRSVGIGQRILVGSLVGITFYMLNKMANYSGLVYELHPVISAVSPTLIFFAFSIYMMRRIF
ncbi:MAG: LPS export ABC transporter permease LptG [Gammaproteobacteria bacterium]